jgi:hypothetical protein
VYSAAFAQGQPSRRRNPGFNPAPGKLILLLLVKPLHRGLVACALKRSQSASQNFHQTPVLMVRETQLSPRDKKYLPADFVLNRIFGVFLGWDYLSVFRYTHPRTILERQHDYEDFNFEIYAFGLFRPT